MPASITQPNPQTQAPPPIIRSTPLMIIYSKVLTAPQQYNYSWPWIHVVPSFSLSLLFRRNSSSLSLGLCVRPSGSVGRCRTRPGICTIGVPIRLFTFDGGGCCCCVASPEVTAVAEDAFDVSLPDIGSLTISTCWVWKICSGFETDMRPLPPEKEPGRPLEAVVQVPILCSGSVFVARLRF